MNTCRKLLACFYTTQDKARYDEQMKSYKAGGSAAGGGDDDGDEEEDDE